MSTAKYVVILWRPMTLWLRVHVCVKFNTQYRKVDSKLTATKLHTYIQTTKANNTWIFTYMHTNPVLQTTYTCTYWHTLIHMTIVEPPYTVQTSELRKSIIWTPFHVPVKYCSVLSDLGLGQAPVSSHKCVS